jgi:hypothetical protein
VKSDLTTEIVNVDLEQAFKRDLQADIALRRCGNCLFHIDFVEEYKITIDGEIKKPGVYDYYEGLTLNDLLVQAGGLTVLRPWKLQRMIMSEEIDDNPKKS